MRTIERSTAFKRDYKRESKSKYCAVLDMLLKEVLVALATDQSLATHYRDHQLGGNLTSYRECHIKPDLLLIYRKLETNTLQLVRLGSHGELFG